MPASDFSDRVADGINTSSHPVVPVRDPPRLRVHLLGGFRVALGDLVVADAVWRVRKARGLVKLLALAPSHALHREELMELLWPNLDPDAAANNLRYAVHIARRAIQSVAGESRVILPIQAERLVLYPAGPVWVDVEAFEAAAAAARRTADRAAYDTALDLYSGDLLPEDRYEDWLAGRREALRATSLALLIDVAQLHEVRHEYAQAIQALERVVAVESAHEQAHVSLMRLYALGGQRTRALRQYQQLQDGLRRGLDARPDPASQQFYGEIHAGHFPPAVPAAPRHNLPAPVTSFIGRERALATVKDLMGTTRQLTLTGAGGSGKTRLALAVAADLMVAYSDGVWLVELASLADPPLAPAVVAGALGVHEEPGRSLRETLMDALRSKRLLLVLDNCEHLIEAIADLSAALLAASPGLQILATSREALRTEGELTWPVPSLALPEPMHLASLETLRGVEAVALFLDRIRLRQPDFILTTQNAPAVVEVCRRLDGLPLAIELAAARVPALTIEQLASRLGDALSVLTVGNRTAVPRHQTLRAALDWSYALLGSREQTLLERLAVFAGGWTLEAAETVAAGEGIDAREVLDLLTHLVDKSLAWVDSGSSEARYRLLEPIRQYALERLRTSRDEERVRRQHAAYYLALAERANTELERAQQVESLERLEMEHDNLRAVLAWSLDRREVSTTVQLGWALALFWYTHGHFSEGRRWMAAAVDSGVLPVWAHARALCVAAAMALGQADVRAVSILSEECLSLTSDIDDEVVKATILIMLGHVAMQQRDYARARELIEESLRLSREQGHAWEVTLALDGLGQVLLLEGDDVRATQVLEECLALAREAGNKTHIAQSLTSLGRAALLQGDYQRAIQLHEESLRVSRELGYSIFIMLALHRIGWAAILHGNSDLASAALEESLSLAEEQGNARYIALVLHPLALVTLLQGDYRRAMTLLQQSLAMSSELRVEELIIDCVEGIAAVAGSQANADRAATLWGAVERLREAARIPDTGVGDAFYGRYRTATRAQLGESAWAAAWVSGQAMTLDQAVAFALATAEPVPPGVLGESVVGPQPSILTPREHEVAILVARGLTNHQIASELGMAQRTADTHVSHILHKLGLASRARVRDWAEAHGLPPADCR